MRHLHRILRKNGLSRSKEKTCLNLVMRFVRKQLEDTSSLIGYRYMHLKARAAGLVVDRETIRLVMKVHGSRRGVSKGKILINQKRENTFAMDQMKHGTWTATIS